jgi:hypothetical protein
LSISQAKWTVFQDELDRVEKTRLDLEALMYKHFGIQTGLDGQAQFEGCFGTPDSPEHEAAMASLFKARDVRTYSEAVYDHDG